MTFASAVYYEGKIYVTGFGRSLSNCAIYDTGSNEWTEGPELNHKHGTPGMVCDFSFAFSGFSDHARQEDLRFGWVHVGRRRRVS